MNSFQEAVSKASMPKKKASKKGNDPFPAKLPESLKKMIDTFVQLKKQISELDAQKKLAANSIVEHAKQVQDNEGLKGNYQNSYDLKGIDEKVKFISSDYWTLDMLNVDMLKHIFGKLFDEYFRLIHEVKLKNEVLEDEELQAKLMKLIGKNKFETFFDVEVTLKPVTGFDEKIYSASKQLCPKNSDVKKKLAKLDEIRMYATQRKSYLK